ncbi:hypothetical protein FACS1894172_17370 [Spirochaetia bacterium]|nr:hypothetical protein FACS1894172_17370 [Spirochaetia bacterium]
MVIDLTGHTVDSTLRPSSDTETHRILYLGFPSIRGICHTHSTYAVAWAQSRLSVPVLGTTHADHNTHEIPCTGFMSADAVKHDYELETGNLIIRTFQSRKEDPDITTMVLVAGHGPFTWGESAVHAVYHSAILEEICKMAYLTLTINPRTQPLPEYIIHKHWERKHGAKAYYGQK